MSIRALITGVLHADPETRIGKSGKPFTTGKLRADAQDGGTTWVSLVAFGDLADTLADLKAGASIAVSGKVKLTCWLGKDNEPAAGLDLVIDEIITLKGKPRPKSDRPPSKYPQHRPLPETTDTVPANFDDDLAEWRT